MESVSFDLARQSVRELNQYLHHDLLRNTVKQVEVENPNGAHNIAVGMDRDVANRAQSATMHVPVTHITLERLTRLEAST